MKNMLRGLGILAALAAVILGVVGTNVDATGVSKDVNPLGAVAVAIAALALLKASELVD
jgi:hypothetical protein